MNYVFAQATEKYTTALAFWSRVKPLQSQILGLALAHARNPRMNKEFVFAHCSFNFYSTGETCTSTNGELLHTYIRMYSNSTAHDTDVYLSCHADTNLYSLVNAWLSITQ